MSITQSIRAKLRQHSTPDMRDRVRRSKIRGRREPGPPPGVDRDALADVAQQILGAPARRYLHASVSGYKEATAFIVWLEGAGRQSVRVFFKDVDLAPERYPAIAGFPGKPGLPEAELYAHPNEALEPFLPRIHAYREIEPQSHYQYFLEDLNATHRWGFDQDDILLAVDQLFEVSAGIADWIGSNATTPVIRYDGEFATSFIAYAHDALTNFAEVTGDADTLKIIDQWDAISNVYLDETPDSADDAVHGDFHRENMFHHRKNPAGLTVVDWEFMGMGWIHNDLASLLKRAQPETVDAALTRVAEARPERTLDDHWRMYQRCRLERGLLDAAIVANQRLATSDNPKLSTVHFRRISDAHRLLTNDGPGHRRAPGNS